MKNLLLPITIMAMFIATPALAADETTAEAKSKSTSADKPVVDIIRESIDPFVPGKERSRFLRAAGKDSELTEKEFESNRKARKPFAREFDKWKAIARFDADKSGKIDWFEAQAYRRGLRKKVLATYDKNKDRKLKGAERDAANKALASGKIPTPDQALAKNSNNNAKPALPTERKGDNERELTREERIKRWRERRAERIKRFDKDGDGKLDETERIQAEEERRLEEQKKFVARYDKNGDGVLDENERVAAENHPRDKWALKLNDFGMKHFDKNGDGKLSSNENKDITKFGLKIMQLGKTWEKKLLDTNKDGNVTPQERSAMQQKMQMAMLGLMPQAMSWADTDGDGSVSRNEREAIMTRVAGAVEREVKKWTNKFDSNGDGRLNEKERDAFIKGVDADLTARIKRHDKNGNGQLDVAEIQTMAVELAEQFGVKPRAFQ